MPDGGKHTGIAPEKAIQFTFWMISTMKKVSNAWIFLLGDRIETGAFLAAKPRAERGPEPDPNRSEAVIVDEVMQSTMMLVSERHRTAASLHSLPREDGLGVG